MTTKPTYSYRDGARYRVNATVVALELKRIGTAGAVAPKAILDAARPTDAPLHPIFEWSDDKAAEQYRLIQARRLIRAVVETRDGTPRRLYVHVEHPSNEGEYVALDMVVHHPDAYTIAFSEAMRRLASAQEAVAELQLAAKGVKPDDYVARIALAAQALSTAANAVRALN